jgi:hypothetical protein
MRIIAFDIYGLFLGKLYLVCGYFMNTPTNCVQKFYINQELQNISSE